MARAAVATLEELRKRPPHTSRSEAPPPLPGRRAAAHWPRHTSRLLVNPSSGKYPAQLLRGREFEC